MQKPDGKPNGTDIRPWLLPLMTLGLCIGIMLGCNADHWGWAASATVLTIISALLLPGRPRLLALTLAALGLGAWVAYAANHPALPPEGEYAITGVVVKEITVEEERFVTWLDDVTLNGEAQSSGAYWSAYFDEGETLPEWFQPGVRVSFRAEVYHPSGPDNPGGYDFRGRLLQEGVTYGVYGVEEMELVQGDFSLKGAMAAIRHRLAMGFIKTMGEENGAMAAAMLLGTRDYIAEEDSNAFSDLGIAHILSVSGYHVGVLAMLLTALTKPFQLSRWARTLLQAAVMAAYVLLTGASAPVVRAAFLLVLRDAGKLMRRRNAPIHLLCLAAAMQLLYRPMQLFGASFQLSYGAMVGIVLVLPRLKETLCTMERSWFREGLSVSLAAQLGILPGQLYWFCGFPLISIVINVPAVALTSVVMTLYWVMLPCLAIPGLRDVLGTAVGWITSWMLKGIRFLADVVGGSVWTPQANVLTVLGWAALLLGLSILLKRDRRWLRHGLVLTGSLMMAVSLIPLPNTGTSWMQFSVGEADAALLHDRDQVIAVDAGEEGYELAGYLRQERLSLDALIITHLHVDHAGGIQALLDYNIPVERCYLPVGAEMPEDIDPIVLELLAKLEDRGTTMLRLQRGDVVETANATLTVLWPQSEVLRTGMEANDTSLVLHADILGSTLLLTGDLTGAFEGYCAVPADILKAAHHGSAQSTTEAFQQTVNPQTVLLSCGNEEREASLLPRLNTGRMFSTNTLGAITIRFTEGAYTVEGYLPEAPE